MIEDRPRRRASPERVIDGENGVLGLIGQASPPPLFPFPFYSPSK